MAKLGNYVEIAIQQYSLLVQTCGCSQYAKASQLCQESVTEANHTLSPTPKKLVKVAILGRPNAGKSTLINKILNKNVCDVSSKTHTTRFPLSTSYITGNTQIVFVDTPGLVTKRELKKFDLDKSFYNWQKKVLDTVDVIGIIHELPCFSNNIKFHLDLLKNLNELEKTKPIFLIFSKVDLVRKKRLAIEALDAKNESNGKYDNPESWKGDNISKVFYISALKNWGVNEIIDYLVGEAKEKEWTLDNKVYDISLNLLIENLIRAKILDFAKQEIPYKCTYEVEYCEENSLGELVCVALVTCLKFRHLKIILSQRKLLRTICGQIEADLYNIIKKVVKLRVVFTTKKLRKLKGKTKLN